MGRSTIEWTQFTVNPIRARLRDAAHAGLSKGGYGSGVGHYCEKIGPDCLNCYASGTQVRFGMPEFMGASKGKVIASGGEAVAVNDMVEVFFDESVLQEVLRRRTPTTWFWCDMTDMFGAWVPDAWIDRCFAVAAATPWHTHQFLTKRTDRMAEYLASRAPGKEGEVSVQIVKLLNEMRPELGGRNWTSVYVPEGHRQRWPIPNLWLGCSAGNQKTYDERVDALKRCPAAVRFLSLEPLIGPIDDLKWDVGGIGDFAGSDRVETRYYDPKIHWVIAGGESGPGARPMHPDWARSIRDRCQAAGVAFFFKQWGEWKPLQGEAITDGEIAIGRVGKKAAGRSLDGRTWDEMPAAAVYGSQGY